MQVGIIASRQSSSFQQRIRPSATYRDLQTRAVWRYAASLEALAEVCRSFFYWLCD